MSEIGQAKTAYREIGVAFLRLANMMDEKLLAEIKSGVAQQFWSAEIERALWPLLDEEVKHGKHT
jgi:hypothetical protein